MGLVQKMSDWEEIEHTLSEFHSDYDGAVKVLSEKGITEGQVSNWLYLNVK